MPDPLPEPQDLISAIPELESHPAPELFLRGQHATLALWLGVALVALAAAGVLWWVRRRARKLPPPRTPLQQALDRLHELAEQLPPLKECGLQVSLTIRRYLQGAVQDPALYETHEEFSRRIDALVAVPEACRYDTRNLLERLADLKYADTRESDPVRARALVDEAATLLRRIQDIQQQAAAAASATTTTHPTA